MRAQPVHVEIAIDAPLEEVWEATQDPARHREWDLRFTRIEYLPRATPEEPRQFRYATRLGFGLWIEGRGESTGTLEKNGERTSALRFWSEDPRSLIRAGSGYWKYVPEGNGVRFLTRYDYTTRFGAAGRLFDRLVFRPAIGWATAWSFDCLRLALEQGTSPRALLACSAARSVSRLVLALVWIYQGVFPKLLFLEGGELELLRAAGFVRGEEEFVLRILGLGEVLFGVLLLVRFRSRKLLRIMLVMLALLLLGALSTQPSFLVAPFNPTTLTLTMVGLAAVELFLARIELPSAVRCRREA